jgi:hypothetical protein
LNYSGHRHLLWVCLYCDLGQLLKMTVLSVPLHNGEATATHHFLNKVRSGVIVLRRPKAYSQRQKRTTTKNGTPRRSPRLQHVYLRNSLPLKQKKMALKMITTCAHSRNIHCSASSFHRPNPVCNKTSVLQPHQSTGEPLQPSNPPKRRQLSRWTTALTWT